MSKTTEEKKYVSLFFVEFLVTALLGRTASAISISIRSQNASLSDPRAAESNHNTESA